MGYIVFVIILCIVVVLGFVMARSQDSFSSRNKLILLSLVILLVSSIGVYNLLQSEQSEMQGSLKLAFVQGEKIICSFEGRELSIKREDFNLINGTMSFLGKPNTSLSGISIPLQHCHVQKDE